MKLNRRQALGGILAGVAGLFTNPLKTCTRQCWPKPPAISVPYATLPLNVYIRRPRYRVVFDKIVTPRFTKETDELRTWVTEIR